MRFTSRFAAGLALALGGVLGGAAPAAASWNSVFQVCCHNCDRPRASFFAPAPEPCPTPCPQPEVRISYVQRSYYQPVTEYVRRSYYEPVQQTYTSYYYEPVTSYSYTTYYDPCTGCPQRVCTPTTSYRLRSKCNSVTSFVERCAMVPVTTLKPVTVRQPVVSYYYPPEPVCPPGGTPMIPPAGPTVDEQRAAPPGVMPERGGTGANIPQTDIPTTPGGMNSFPRGGSNVRLKPEKTVSRSSVVTVRGEVVLPDQLTPRGGAKLVFVNADRLDQREYATANAYGEFDLKLAAGDWLLYVGEDGRANYHKKISLGEKATVDYKVVSR